jgi:hypothetical protein
MLNIPRPLHIKSLLTDQSRSFRRLIQSSASPTATITYIINLRIKNTHKYIYIGLYITINIASLDCIRIRSMSNTYIARIIRYQKLRR